MVVGKVGEKAPVFESTDLKEGDLFAATLIRPGTYSVVNLNTQARGEAVVEYPNLGKEPYHPPPPLMIECTKDALKPSRIRLKPAQGHVYSFKTRSRIKIELSRADDGYENEHRPGLSEGVSH